MTAGEDDSMSGESKYELAMEYLAGLLADGTEAEIPPVLSMDEPFRRLEGMIRAHGERLAALRRSEAEYRSLFENATESIAVVVGGRIALTNAMLEKLAGADAGHLKGMPFESLFSEEDQATAAQYIGALMNGQTLEQKMTLRVLAKIGVVWLEVRGVPIDWHGEKALIFYLVDVTQRKKAETALTLSEEKYRLMAENAQDVIWVLDLTTGCFTYVSPSVLSLRGVTAEEAMREYIADTMTKESYDQFSAHLKKRVLEFENGSGEAKHSVVEIEQFTKDGSTVSTEISIKLRLNVYGGLEAVGISRDITTRKSSERKILYLNQHDPLTDLYNRRFYTDQMEILNTPENLPLSMVLIDVNGMKLMNDAFGHMVGDKLLVNFAQVLRTSLRTTDIAARIGGDEFVLLLPKTNEEAAGRIVERIKAALANAMVEEVAITASFGIAAKQTVEEDFSDVYRAAEDNMYRDKLVGNRQLKTDLLRQILANLYRKSDVERRHSESVSRLCMAVGRELRMDYGEIEKLGVVGLYHDIGKVALDESLINKPGELNEEEMAELSKHPEISYQILRSFAGMGEVAESVLLHHRRVDGAGYPDVNAKELPIEARILSVAEAYDMMTGAYPFSPVLTVDQAIRELESNSDSQFDGDIVRVFIDRVLQGADEQHALPCAGLDG